MGDFLISWTILLRGAVRSLLATSKEGAIDAPASHSVAISACGFFTVIDHNSRRTVEKRQSLILFFGKVNP